MSSPTAVKRVRMVRAGASRVTGAMVVTGWFSEVGTGVRGAADVVTFARAVPALRVPAQGSLAAIISRVSDPPPCASTDCGDTALNT